MTEQNLDERIERLSAEIDVMEAFFNRAMLTNYQQSPMIDRSMLSGGLGMNSHGGLRNYNQLFGYPLVIPPETAQYWYSRDGLTHNALGSLAYDSWRKPPAISEDGDRETPFAKAFDQFAQKHSLWTYLMRLDKLQRLGEYAIMVIGFNDSRPDAPTMANVASKPVNREDGLPVVRLSAYGQDAATITEWDSDGARFGLPKRYQVQIGGKETHVARAGSVPPSMSLAVHHSRVIHMCEEPLSNDALGVSPFGVVYNTLIDNLKVSGGSAEASLQNIKQKFVQLMKDTAPGIRNEDRDDRMWKMKKKLEGLSHSMEAAITLRQTDDFKVISGSLHDPSGAHRVTGERVAAGIDKPLSMIRGNQESQIASDKDHLMYAGTIDARQQLTCQPVLRDCIDRLINFGSLPEPASGSYNVGDKNEKGDWHWPSILVQTDKDSAETSHKRGQTIFVLQRARKAGAKISDGEIRLMGGLPEELPDDYVMEDDEGDNV